MNKKYNDKVKCKYCGTSIPKFTYNLGMLDDILTDKTNEKLEHMQYISESDYHKLIKKMKECIQPQAALIRSCIYNQIENIILLLKEFKSDLTQLPNELISFICINNQIEIIAILLNTLLVTNTQWHFYGIQNSRNNQEISFMLLRRLTSRDFECE